MEPNMERPPPDPDDPRYVAKRLFEALCAQYPGKYIALIQPRDVANEPLPAPEVSDSEAPGSPQRSIPL
jgi:hypothetical protein